MANDTCDLSTQYLLLEPDGAAVRLPGGRGFWGQLMSGAPTEPDIRRVMESEQGRLLTVLTMEADWTGWEMHPAGDEILYMLAGDATFLLELGDELKAVELVAGRALVVPRGVWHTARVSRPARLLAITPGHGTQHRSA